MVWTGKKDKLDTNYSDKGKYSGLHDLLNQPLNV